MERETMAEKLIDLDSIELAVAVFGNCDQNIRLLESELGELRVQQGELRQQWEKEKNAGRRHVPPPGNVCHAGMPPLGLVDTNFTKNFLG